MQSDEKSLSQMENQKEQARVLVLGIGNILWADEGFGVRALEYFRNHYRFGDNVTLMDGGTQGIYLVQNIRETDILVVFDAVDYGLPGGSLKRIEGDNVPKFLGCKKVSLHQTGFQEVLAMAQMLGDYPQHLLLVGVQPVELEDFGGSLRPQVKAQIQPAIDLAIEYLSSFSIQVERRAKPLSTDVIAAGAISDIEFYESGRPSEQQAYRYGDERVIKSKDFRLHYQPEPIDGVDIPVDHHLDKYRHHGS